MDPEFISSLATNLGICGTLLVLHTLQTWKREQNLAARISELENYIHDKQTKMIQEQHILLVKNTEMIETCIRVLGEVGGAIQTLSKK